MSKPNCDACTELREYAPTFVMNGVTNAVAKNLKNNKGVAGAKNHNNCEDLNDVVDCLIGRLGQEVESLDVCDWKDFMSRFIPNLYETLKAMVMSECGTWCKVTALMEGFTMKLGETPSSGGSYLVAGKGVSFLQRGQAVTESDARMVYVGGAFMTSNGSLTFHVTDFVDEDGTQREGNTVWGEQDTATVYGNELVLEFRVNLAEFPEVKRFYRGTGALVNNGADTLIVTIFTEGEYAYGAHGACNTQTGEPAREGLDRGNLVPEGWTYVQIRMNHIDKLVTNGDSIGHTYRVTFGVRLDMDQISC